MARKRQLTFNNFKLIASVLVVGALILSLLQWIQNRRVKFVHYDAFGIDMPVAYSIHGIDVSRYQQQIAWKGVKEMNVGGIQLNFTFIKATEGITLTDKFFKYNWRNAKKQQLPRGAYHFFIPTQDPVKQAEYFISRVKLEPGDLPPVLDVEQLGNIPSDEFKKKVKAWLAVVEEYYGVMPIIYSYADFYKKHLGSDFDDYPLWIAHYYERHKPRINRPWTFWQHNDRGNVNGIKAKVDFNVFNGDIITFNKLLIQ